MPATEKSFQVKNAVVEIHADKRAAGEAAAQAAREILRECLGGKGSARIIVGTGASQLELVETLVGFADLEWSAIEVFHMDEYVGLPLEHPASFRGWLKTRLADKVPVSKVHYLSGESDDLEAECDRYAREIEKAPIDLCFLGFGENGHIAFNDPHVADFGDPLPVKKVAMDERCRMQQVGEGAFPDLAAVPEEALTLTIPTLFECVHLICTVPEQRKAEAVKNALEGPLSTKCPASIVPTHSSVRIFLDRDSASFITDFGATEAV